MLREFKPFNRLTDRIKLNELKTWKLNWGKCEFEFHDSIYLPLIYELEQASGLNGLNPARVSDSPHYNFSESNLRW